MPGRLGLAFTIMILAACATQDGLYAPDCLAYSGDRIELDDGRFVWDKFTDQVKIDETGETVDPYPEFPVQGRYLTDGDRFRFLPETDVTLPDLYGVERDRRHYLLTAAQYETWQRDGDFAHCALLLGADH